MPPRRKSTDYTRRRPPGAEEEPEVRQLSPQERRRQMMIHAGVWFLVLVFAMTSGVMCFNIGDQATRQAVQEAAEPQDPIQAEIDRWTREAEAAPADPVPLANLGHYWIRKAASLPENAEPTPAGSPAPGSPSPAATPAMTRGEALSRAEDYLKRALEKDPKYAFALQQMADVRVLQKKPAEARTLLEKVLELAQEPVPEGEDKATFEANRANQTTRARMGLAMLEAGEKNYDKALEILDVVLKDQPGNLEAWIARSSVLRDQGRVDEALEALDSAVKVAEGMEDYGQALGVRVEKSRIYQEKGDKAAARGELEKARQMAERSGNPQISMIVAQMLYSLDGPPPAPPAGGLPTGPSPAVSPAAAQPATPAEPASQAPVPEAPAGQAPAPEAAAGQAAATPAPTDAAPAPDAQPAPAEPAPATPAP